MSESLTCQAMENSIELFLLGSLGKRAGLMEGQSKRFELKASTPLYEVLKLLHLEPEQVQMAMVNHRAVPSDHLVQPGDRVALFPKEYPLFADWNTFRSPNRK
jgi:molybdopterin converting factor small subunit